MKQTILIILAVVSILTGAILLGKNKDGSDGTPSSHVYGNPDSPIVLVEYGDFECPACGAFFPIVSQVKETYKDQIRFEFRNFPLVQIHPNAQAAHRAAEAASKQGKFWEMHDILYERQRQWSSSSSGISNPTPVFESYAQELELDLEQFKTDVAAGATLATINADVALGKLDGAEGTPTFLLNGELVEDLTLIDTPEKFGEFIDQAISAQKASAASADNQNEAESPSKPEDAVTE